MEIFTCIYLVINVANLIIDQEKSSKYSEQCTKHSKL